MSIIAIHPTQYLPPVDAVVPDVIEPTHLYIKQHRTTGKLYFGMTTKDVFKYKGSGKHWLRHLRKHGYDVETLWTKLFTDPAELVGYAIAFSESNDIVKSPDWANMELENGVTGAPQKHRTYISPEGTKQRFAYNTQPEGWIVYSAVRGTRLYSNGAEVKRFKHNEQPTGWVEFANVTNVGCRQHQSPDGSFRMFVVGEAPDGWVELSPNKNKRAYISPEGLVTTFTTGQQPEGWITYNHNVGKRQYRNPVLKDSKFFITGQQPEGYFEYHSRVGYKDKSIVE
jgi:hypothetical protein